MIAVESSSAPRLLVVEDDSETREYLVECLDDGDRYHVDSAGTLADALQHLRSDAPDLVLVDLGLPDGNGIDLIRYARRVLPRLQVLVISAFGDERSLIGALEAGARGYLLKSETPADIRLAVDQIRDGGAPISPGIASHLLERFAPKHPVETANDPADCTTKRREIELTDRELEVLELVVRGLSHQESADVLHIRRDTVAAHVKSIYRKLEVHSRGEATFQAIRKGIIQVDKEDS